MDVLRIDYYNFQYDEKIYLMLYRWKYQWCLRVSGGIRPISLVRRKVDFKVV